MVTLDALDIAEKKKKQFISKGINSGEDLVRFLPRKYMDFQYLTGILSEDQVSVIQVRIKEVNCVIKKSRYVVADCIMPTLQTISIFWFNQVYMYNSIKQMIDQEVVVAGKVKYDASKQQYSISGPLAFGKVKDGLRIYPVYSKISGMSMDYLEEHIKAALAIPECTRETLPSSILAQCKLMSMPEALRELHNPQSMEALEQARMRMKFDELLYFALRLELANRNLPTTSKHGITSTEYWDKLRASLPYSLTEDQQSAIDGMAARINSGQRLNALLQGDVGAGKTIVAFAMMCLVISSGCQAVIVAPTRQLASQHYEDMKAMLEPLGIRVALYGDTTMKKSQRDQIARELANGTIQIAVGTHALFSPKVSFYSLGLVVIDEEHKFGVAQRKALVDRVSEGVHCITMSATPIPRSLAAGLYGDSMQVFSIMTLPNGRLPIKTVAFTNGQQRRLNNFIRFQYKSGHQTYVVCPAIEKGSSASMDNVVTIDKAEKWLSSFESEGIKYEVLTGKTNKTDAAAIIDRFKRNETNVLLATSVIEVGINIPSATGIIILSAERFGLASLHQLRGRVGRGKDQGYCVLWGYELEHNERAAVMCSTTNGFKIAEADLEQRGTGDFLGKQQSGDNKYVSLMLQHQEEFQRIFKPLAKQSIDNGDTFPLLEQAVADFRAEED